MIQKRSGWARAKGDVEEDVAGGRAATKSRPCDDATNLLVTWTHDAELGRDCADTPVRFSDGRGVSVEALGSGDETHVDSRSELEHVSKGELSRQTQVARAETKETK